MHSCSRKLTQLATRDKGLYILCLSVALVTLFWILQSRIGLSMGDEGYLLYGSWRVGQGEVPIRDFSSYDPARYYWVAFWSWSFGYDIIGQRAGVAIFQITGLVLGLFAARRVARQHWSLFLAGILLVVWTWPRYRVFESAVSMAAVLVGTRLIERPVPRRVWSAGIFVGVAALFGRNLGLYSLAAFLSILLMLRWQVKIKFLPAVARLFGGILLGYSPTILLMLIYPGFLASFITSILAMLKRGTTNKSLPIPWPWNATLAGQDWLQDAHQIFTGVAFLIVFAFLAIGLTSILRRPSQCFVSRPLLGAATLVGLMYAHHLSVRSDLLHLTSVIHPVLLGLLCLIAGFSRRQNVAAVVVAVALATLTAFAPLYQQPYIQRLLYPNQFASETVQGERLWILPSQASYITAVRSNVERELRQEDLVFFAPYTPVMYFVLGRKSPVWDTYPLWPASPEMQHQMIGELERTRPKYAIVSDLPLDGDDAWRFSNTHPEVWNLLQENFQIVEDKTFPNDYIVFRRRQSPGP